MQYPRIAILMLLATAVVAKEPDWKQGKLVNLVVGSQTSIKHGKSKAHRTFTFTVDGGDRTYDGVEVGKTLHLEVNAPVEYATEKDHLYLKDPAGKSHKLDLVKTTRNQ